MNLQAIAAGAMVQLTLAESWCRYAALAQSARALCFWDNVAISGDELKLEHELYEAGIVRKFFFSVMSHTVLCHAKVLRAFEL